MLSDNAEIIQNNYLELMRLVALDLGIIPIIKEAAEILGNPIVVTDESYNLVGYSSSSDVKDPIWNTIIENGYCPMDIVNILREEGFEKQLEKETSPLFLTKDVFSKYIRRLVSEIRIGEQLKGYIALLEYEKSITSTDEEVLKFVSSVIALEFAKSDAIAKAQGHLGLELLSDLVKGNIVTETSALNRVKALKWSLGEYFQVLIVSGKENQTIGKKYYDDIQSLIMRQLPASKIGLASNYVVILATGNNARLTKAILPELETFCADHSLFLGIGRYCMTLTEISVSYNEAKRALALANILKKEEIVYYYDELAVYDFLNNLQSDYKIHPALKKLIEYDKDNGTEYVKTFSVYLKSFKNLTHTAEKLFLHRNTVLYRLKKIEEILQIDLNNYNLCLRLQLDMLSLEMK